MLQFRARPLRTALIATALVTAVAAPAAAASTTPDAGTVAIKKRIRSAAPRPQAYELLADVQGRTGTVNGNITWADDSVRVLGTISDTGPGTTVVTFRMVGTTGEQTKQFSHDKAALKETAFTQPGEFNSMTIEVCKTYQGQRDCANGSYQADLVKKMSRKKAVKPKLQP